MQKNLVLIIHLSAALMTINEVAAQANTSLSNLTTTAVNQSLVPNLNNGLDMGSSTLRWRNMYMQGSVFYGNLKAITFTNENAGLGVRSLESNTSGLYNTASGNWALLKNTTGSNNTANGNRSLFNNTTGARNTANGYGALYFNTTGNSNTASGTLALYNNTGGYSNVAIGAYAFFKNINSANSIAIGDSAMYNFSSSGWGISQRRYNIAIGSKALFNYYVGDYNTVLGALAAYNTTTGYANTCVGYLSLEMNTTGTTNTAIGMKSLGANTTGTLNTALGFDADVVAGNLTNATAIGAQTIVYASNQVRIGNTAVTVIGGMVGWSNFSDGRFKKNIRENVPGLAFINKLRPLTYTVDFSKYEQFTGAGQTSINDRPDNNIAAEQKVRTGFIAQEVEQAAKEINYDFDGINKPQHEKDNYSIVYADFVPSLVKAVQELSQSNDEKDARIDDLQQQIEALKKTIATALANKTSAATQNESVAVNIDNAHLEQNTPNPFKQGTVIKYYVPSTVRNAVIIITTANGQQIKSFALVNKGSGQVSLQAGQLASGTYQYTLYTDGKIADSKKMVITR